MGHTRLVTRNWTLIWLHLHNGKHLENRHYGSYDSTTRPVYRTHLAPIRFVLRDGPVHTDGFLAACLALTQADDLVRIDRRPAEEQELDDPAVWIIDAGRRYAPDRKNFDHRHDPALPPTAILVARHMDVAGELADRFPWWTPGFLARPVIRGDGSPHPTPPDLPVEGFVLGALSRATTLTDYHWVVSFMRRFGRYLLQESRPRSSVRPAPSMPDSED